ncbi:MAG: glycosyltransferase family 2 protein [Burkholderiales bacterium]|nr:glycosyltransferase family 2 protein [Burkholderiales bacterium]
MENDILLSIIIVNYNGRHFLADCLESIATHVSCRHEVILVDNASSDGSCDFMRQRYPRIRLVESPVNTGFTGGNNLGARYAQGRILFLLNNDTKLSSDIGPILSEFDDDTLGVLGCRLFYGDGRQQWSYGYEHTPARLVFSWLGLGGIAAIPNWFRRQQMDPDAYGAPHRNVDWVSGAALLTPKVLWGRLAGLDEGYFMYIEDVDYCRRVRDAGYRVAYSPGAEVIHYEGAGRPWLGGKALKYSMQSYIRYTRKFHSPLAVLLLRVSLVMVMFCRSLVYAVISLFSGSALWEDKRKAYLEASLILCKK